MRIFLNCVHCPCVVRMDRLEAKAHGWTCIDTPIRTVASTDQVDEVWTCPKCNGVGRRVA